MNRARLFFALWPNDAEAAETAGAARKLLGGLKVRQVPKERLHLTLLFLGSVRADSIGALVAAAQNVGETCFDLRFDQFGYWRRPRVAWLAPSAPPAALMRLSERLRAAMPDLDVPLESRQFRPHITLARKVVSAPASALAAPLLWHINSFGLYQSVTHAGGPEYTRVGHFPLAGA